MKKRIGLLFLVAIMIVAFGSIAVAADSQQNIVLEDIKIQKDQQIDYVSEIEKLKQEEIEYQISMYKEMNSEEQIEFAQNIGLNITNEALVKAKIEKLIENAFVYYITESGDIYDETGYIGALEKSKILSPGSTDSILMDKNELQSNAKAAATNTIVGADTGAFIRQVSVTGYMGSTSTFKTPTTDTANSTNYLNCKNGSVGYMYNKLDLNDHTFSMEGGLMYNTGNKDYSPYVRVNGGSMNFKDLNGDTPDRFKANTSFTHNLRYEHANGKVKYYASGTSIYNASQSVVMGYAKTFTTTQVNNLRAGRLTGLAKGSYNGVLDLGTLIVSYTNTTLCKSGTSTTYTNVSLTSSLLDSWTVNNKIYGTSVTPTGKTSQSPTSGSFSSQVHKVDFR